MILRFKRKDDDPVIAVKYDGHNSEYIESVTKIPMVPSMTSPTAFIVASQNGRSVYNLEIGEWVVIIAPDYAIVMGDEEFNETYELI